MIKRFSFRLTSLLIIILLLPLGVSLQGADFAVYTGSGTWQESIDAFESFLEWKNLSWEEVSASDINSNDLRPLYKGIFLPGGWAYNYKKSIRDSGDQHIRDFISDGGAYIGMSAGAFYACDNVVWEGQDYPYYLNLFHGDCIGPIDEIAPWPTYVMTTMSINQNHPANIYEPATEDILYYGEPYFIAYPNQEMQIFASWNVPSNSLAHQQGGIIGFNYGSGRALLVGPHPEIEENSGRDGSDFGSELNDNGSDWPFLWTAVDWLLQQPISQPRELPSGNPTNTSDTLAPVISGTWITPETVIAGQLVTVYANISDAIGVETALTTILEIPHPMNRLSLSGSTLFYDNFESGSLAGWTTTAVSGGNKWLVATSNPYQGTKYAESKPQSTNEPASILERSISTVGSSTLKLQYVRRLVGIDGVDEFKAKWFDGTSWYILEQSGSASANDAGYVLKSFILPASANNNPSLRIRFECTAGAVSEFCRIDNVNLSSSSSPSNTYTHSFNTSGLEAGTYVYAVSANDSAGNQPIPVGGEFSVL